MWQKRFFGRILYSIHDMRRGLQMLFRRARIRGNMNLPEDLRRDYGLWKRPKKSNTESYAGLDHVLMDEIYMKVLEWDVNSLVNRLPTKMGASLLEILSWV